MNKSQYIERKIVDYTLAELPFSLDKANIKLIDVSQIRLSLSNKKYPMDIGCIAYAERKRKSPNQRTSDYHTILVNPQSFKKERLEKIENLLESIFTAFKIGSSKDISIGSNALEFLNAVSWIDNNGMSHFLENQEYAREATIAYSDYLIHKIRVSELGINSASTYQQSLISMISKMFGIHSRDFSSGLRLISQKEHSANRTRIPEEQKVHKVLSLCDIMFDGLADFIIGEKSFPYLLKLPKEDVWVLPLNKWMATKAQLKQRDDWKRYTYRAWDYENGKIAELNKIIQKPGKTSPVSSYNQALNTLSVANTDKRHVIRLKIAVWAQHLFIVQLFANTAINNSSLVNMRWNDDYVISPEFQGFRSIKFRAKGKEVSFLVGSSFIPKFKKFLKIRSYLLDGQPFDYFLVNKGKHSIEDPKQVRAKPLLATIFRNIRNMVDPTIEDISSREWRAYKADYLIKNTKDVATTSLILQNKPETVIKHYINGSRKETDEELSSFFKYINKHVFLESQISNEEHYKTSVGHCSSNMKNPTSLIKEDVKLIEPDCRQPEGCLYCENYAIHTDDIDIRKLLSLEFIIKETTILAKSEEHHYKLFGITLNRISDILEVISLKSKKHNQLVNDIRSDVFENENLDPYWEEKLSMMVKIGLL